MAEQEVKIQERRLKQNEYAGMVLAIATPLIGLFFALYLHYEGSEWGLRLVGISIVSAIIWTGVILFL